MVGETRNSVKSIPEEEVETTAPKTTNDSVRPPLICEDGWKYNNHTKKCYKLFHEPDTWYEAIHSCRWNADTDTWADTDGDLASVPDRETEEFLIELAKSSVGFSDSLWLGGQARKSNGTWLWNDGTPWNYTNWAPNEPNNGSGSEHRLELWWDQPSWNDDDGSEYHGYICQYQRVY